MIDVLRDLLGVVGLVLVAYGLWLIHPAVALVTTGALLFGVAVLLRTSPPHRRGGT